MAETPAPASQGETSGKVNPQKKDQQFIPVPEALAMATQAMQEGKLKEAEALCQQIIQARPRVPETYNLLGVILHRQGQTKDAIKAIKKAVHLNSTVANYYSNLGEMQRLNGDTGDAVVSLRRALVLDPSYVQALNNLGITYYDKTNYDDAAEQYKKALEINPDYAEAHNNLGNALRALKQPDEAIEEYKKAIEIKPDYAEAHNNLATVLREERKFEDSEKQYRAALAINPNYVEAYDNLAGLLIGRERYDEALQCLGQALRINPKSVKALLNTARAQNHKENYPAADMACRKALEEEPNSAEAYCVLGQVFHEIDRFDEAIEHFKKAIELKPDYAECYNTYGVVLKSIGKFEEAKKCFHKTLELRPKAYAAYSNLADNERFTPESELFKSMAVELEEAEDPTDEHYMPLHFAVGKAYDDMGEYEKAFEHWTIGAKQKRAKLTYDENETFAFMDSIREAFPASLWEKQRYKGHPSSLPIFILGMPRSGSTLVEQVLSSHPEVFGAGEVKIFNHSLGALRLFDKDLPKYPDMIKEMKPEHYAKLSEIYLNNMTRFSDTALTVTDKMLTNFYFVGLINLMFPNAKIIHTLRNPMATCLSCYSKLFKEDMPHTYDLGELGRYYRKYEELMAYWPTVLPENVMLDVRYEDVVANFEEEARQLVDFCGLKWDDACLAFHESDRPVKTASVSQVRKPIYKGAVEKWKRYGKRLEPLRQALEGAKA